MDLRQRQQVDVAQDARHAPLVLILQVGAVAQPVDLHRQQVAARLHQVRDVKLRPHVRRLGKPRLDAVDVHRKGAVHPVKAQQNPPLILLPHHRHREFPAVQPDGRVVGHARRVVGEGIVDVDVVGAPVAADLPRAGHGQLVPLALALIVRAEKALGHAVLTADVQKAPDAVEQLVEARQLALSQPGAGQILEGDHVRVRAQPSELLHGRVLPARRGVFVSHCDPSAHFAL